MAIYDYELDCMTEIDDDSKSFSMYDFYVYHCMDSELQVRVEDALRILGITANSVHGVVTLEWCDGSEHVTDTGMTYFEDGIDEALSAAKRLINNSL